MTSQPDTVLRTRGIAELLIILLAIVLFGCGAPESNGPPATTASGSSSGTHGHGAQVQAQSGNSGTDLSGVANFDQLFELLGPDFPGCIGIDSLKREVIDQALLALADEIQSSKWNTIAYLFMTGGSARDISALINFVNQGYTGEMRAKYATELIDGQMVPTEESKKALVARYAFKRAIMSIGTLSARVAENEGEDNTESQRAVTFLASCADFQYWNSDAVAWSIPEATGPNPQKNIEVIRILSGACIQALGFHASTAVEALAEQVRYMLVSEGRWPATFESDMSDSRGIRSLVRRTGGILPALSVLLQDCPRP